MSGTKPTPGPLGDPEFTGEKLLKLVIDIEAAVGANRAGLTPLGRAETGDGE